MIEKLKSVEDIAKIGGENALQTGLEETIEYCVELHIQKTNLAIIQIKLLVDCISLYPDHFEPHYYLSQFYLYDAKNVTHAKKYAKSGLEIINKTNTPDAELFIAEMTKILDLT